MRKLSKYLFLFVAILLFISPIRVQAASQKDVKQITKHVKSYMAAVKKYDIKKIKKDNNNIPVYHCTDKKIQKHLRKINQKHLSYSIKKIKVKGDTATAVIRITRYSLYDDTRQAMRKIVKEYDKKTWSDKRTLKALYNYLMEVYEDNLYYYSEPEDFNTQCMFTYNTKIPLKKINGKWKIAKVTKAMIWDLDGGLTEFIDDCNKNPLIIFD